MLEIWEKGEGIIVLQILSDSDHHIAHCREHAMIKAAGKSLTNLINGSTYGLMKTKWTKSQIQNFGDMLLYFALKQCIVESPSQFYPKNIPMKKERKTSVYEGKKYSIQFNYELNGILDCFLQM